MPAQDRRHGFNGQVNIDTAGGSSLVLVNSLNKWTLSAARQQAKVSAFADTNEIYKLGRPDVKGGLGGWHDAADLTLWGVALGQTPVTLQLVPSTEDPTILAEGLAYLDMSIDVNDQGGIGISSSYVAAGNWLLPGQ